MCERYSGCLARNKNALAAGSFALSSLLSTDSNARAQDEGGQIRETHSVSAGLDYPGVGPEHAWLKSSGRAEYVAVTDKEAIEGFLALTRTEGIIPALESSHAIYHAIQLAKALSADQTILVCLSGRGDKDMGTMAQELGVNLS